MTIQAMAEVVRTKRKEMNLTQEQLAERANVSVISVQRLEMKQKVNLKTIVKIVSIINDDRKITLEDITDLSFE